ncbi:MAG: recombinase zinc beta ribbon domain-containing protein [Candidatus Gastranaerophilaceae bacterium]
MAGKQKATAEYLLSGKLYCGHCGSPMQGVSGTGKSGNRWYYYQCANMKKRIFWNGML